MSRIQQRRDYDPLARPLLLLTAPSSRSASVGERSARRPWTTCACPRNSILCARRGAKKAIFAVAASMLTAAYHMLKNGVEYRDLGAEHFERRIAPKSSALGAAQ